MSNKSNNTDTSGTISTSTEDFKDQSVKHNFSKFEHDLYHDEDNIVLPVIWVKMISLPNKGDRWKVITDNKVTFVLEGSKISKKEKEFLHTIEGFNFILAKAKIGIKNLSGFRADLKKVIDKALLHVEIVKPQGKLKNKPAKRGPKKKKK